MGDLRSDRCDRSRLAIQIDYPRLLCMVYDVWERKRGNDNVTMMPEGGGRYGRTEVQTTDELLGGYKKEQGQLALFHIEPTAGVQGLIPDPLKVVARLLASPQRPPRYMWPRQWTRCSDEVTKSLHSPAPTGARRSCCSRNTHDNDTLPQARPHNRPLTRTSPARFPNRSSAIRRITPPWSPPRGVRISAHLRHRGSRSWAWGLAGGGCRRYSDNGGPMLVAGH